MVLVFSCQEIWAQINNKYISQKMFKTYEGYHKKFDLISLPSEICAQMHNMVVLTGRTFKH